MRSNIGLGEPKDFRIGDIGFGTLGDIGVCLNMLRSLHQRDRKTPSTRVKEIKELCTTRIGIKEIVILISKLESIEMDPSSVN